MLPNWKQFRYFGNRFVARGKKMDFGHETEVKFWSDSYLYSNIVQVSIYQKNKLCQQN